MKRLALLLLAALAAGCGGDGSAGGEIDLSEPAAMMLRLSDFPDGFRYGRPRDCGEVGTTDGGEPELDQFLIATRPRVCFGDFSREWGGEPATVQTVLFVFDSDDDARRAWEVRKTLFDSFGRILITHERAEGDAVPFDSNGVLKPGAGEVWRDGHLVVAVYEEGLPGDSGGREFVADIAAKQKERIDSPSDPSEEDAREVGLDDPAITIPVYWLGREFDAEGLPKLTLYHGDHVESSGGAGSDVKIDYDAEGGGLTLELWKPEAWRRRGARRCGGRARIAICDEDGNWVARSSYDEVVVVAEPTGDPYNSGEAMEAVVKGLRRR